MWLRSYEEDAGALWLYRPEGYPFPPARGRDGLRFGSDGAFGCFGPGRDDRPRTDGGSWRWDPDQPGRITATTDGQTIELRIDGVTEEWLRLQWLDR